MSPDCWRNLGQWQVAGQLALRRSLFSKGHYLLVLTERTGHKHPDKMEHFVTRMFWRFGWNFLVMENRYGARHIRHILTALSGHTVIMSSVDDDPEETPLTMHWGFGMNKNVSPADGLRQEQERQKHREETVKRDYMLMLISKYPQLVDINNLRDDAIVRSIEVDHTKHQVKITFEYLNWLELDTQVLSWNSKSQMFGERIRPNITMASLDDAEAAELRAPLRVWTD